MKSIFITWVLFAPLFLYSQQQAKFGEVSKNELQMRVYEHDSSASAVVLFDKGHFSSEGKFTRHRRIKVLKNAGKSFANISLNVPSKGNISAYVFNLENGQIVKEKLTNSSIYEEEIFNGFHIYKIFIPNVKVGSVIDIRYIHYGIPYEWRFQETIPVAYNELKLERTQYVIYEKQQRGFGKIQEINENHFMVKNVPAYVIEPHVSHYSNYITKFEFQLTKITLPGYFYEKLSTSWPTISEKLMEHPRFGQVIKSSTVFKDSVKAWKKQLTTVQQLEKAYSYLQNEITWNKEEWLFSSRFLNKKLKNEKQGNSADINLTLISMLRKMGVEAYPVVLSTRDNGLLNPLIPNLWKLNYVIAYVVTEKGGMFLDATEKNLVPGLIPQRCLNGQGWIITDDNEGKWVSLEPSNIGETFQMINISLDESQSIVAKVSQKKSSLHYLSWLSDFNQFETDDRFKIHLEDRYDLDIDSYQSKVKSDKGVIMESLTANFDETATDLGQEILLDPFVFCGFLNNPFKSEERLAPIDLMAKSRERSTINITIPDNLVLAELPKSEAFSALEKGIVFVINYNQLGNKLQVQYNFEINKTLYSQQDYTILKNFYSHIIKKISNPIRLIKKT